MGLDSRAGGIPFQEPAWPLVAHSDRRLFADRFDLSRTPPDRIGLEQVTWEVRVAWEEAAVAATRAAQRALTVAAVLDQALTVLEEPEDGAVAAPRV